MLTIGSRVRVRRGDATGECGTITRIDPATEAQGTLYHVRLDWPAPVAGLITKVLWLDAEALEEIDSPSTLPTPPEPDAPPSPQPA